MREVASPYDLNAVGKIMKMSEMERKILHLQRSIETLEKRVRQLEILKVRLK